MTSETSSNACAGQPATRNAAFDRDFLLQELGDDRELLRDLAKMFLETAPEMLGQIHAAAESGDVPALQRQAHKLKGALAQFYAAAAASAAGSIEDSARLNDLPSARNGVPRLDAEFFAVKSELEAVLKEA